MTLDAAQTLGWIPPRSHAQGGNLAWPGARRTSALGPERAGPRRWVALGPVRAGTSALGGVPGTRTLRRLSNFSASQHLFQIFRKTS